MIVARIQENGLPCVEYGEKDLESETNSLRWEYKFCLKYALKW